MSVSDKSSSCNQTLINIFFLGHEEFPSGNATNTSTLSASIANLLRRTRTVCLMHLWSQACWCFWWTLSAICLALYRDTPIPTVAIIMAMGLMRLLCGCICTSPETCLCTRRTEMMSFDEIKVIDWIESYSFYHFDVIMAAFEAAQETRCVAQRWNNIVAVLKVFAVFLIFHNVSLSAACYATWAVEYSLYGADYIRWPPNINCISSAWIINVLVVSPPSIEIIYIKNILMS